MLIRYVCFPPFSHSGVHWSTSLPLFNTLRIDVRIRDLSHWIFSILACSSSEFLLTFLLAHILLVFEKLHSIKHGVSLFGWKLCFSMAFLPNSFSFTLDFSSVFSNFPELWNNLIPSSVGMRHFLTEQDLI